MLAPSPSFSGSNADHKCEGLRLINGAPHTAPKGESFASRTPLARSTPGKSRAADHREGSQEYPVWQAVLRTRQG
jgi:hypothetical protein